MNWIERINRFKGGYQDNLIAAKLLIEQQELTIKALQRENNHLAYENANLLARCKEFEMGVLQA